jgi:hypothetical protein
MKGWLNEWIYWNGLKDRRKDCWMSGFIKEIMDGWTEGWLNELIYWSIEEGWLNEWIYWRMDGRMNGRIVEWMDLWTDRWKDGRKGGWMNAHSDGWTEGWLNEWIYWRGEEGWLNEWVCWRIDWWVAGWLDGWLNQHTKLINESTRNLKLGLKLWWDVSPKRPIFI